MINTLTFFLLAMPFVKIDSSCSLTLSDENISLTIESNFKNSDTLLSNYTVKNISKQSIYIIEDGYFTLEFFPVDTNIVLLDLTDSKLRLGNGHYYQAFRDVELLLPGKTISFSTAYRTPKSDLKKVTVVYEYLPTDKKIKNNKLLGKNLVRLAQKLKVECPCYFN